MLFKQITMNNEIEKRICPYCGVEFIPKRSNQTFCNSAIPNDIEKLLDIK